MHHLDIFMLTTIEFQAKFLILFSKLGLQARSIRITWKVWFWIDESIKNPSSSASDVKSYFFWKTNKVINPAILFCSELSGLWIGYNHIVKIPKRICEAKKLRILDIEFNKVNEIPSCVKRKEVLTIHSQG